MPPGSICDLGSLNLVKMLNKDKSGFDIKKIEKYTKYLVRFLDNVNDYTKTPLKEYDEAIRRRRIGLGILGWGSTLYLLKIRFASDKAEKIKEELMKTICYSAIEASIDLAEEKGMFDGCDPQKHAESEFFKQIDCPKYLLDKMKKFGIRNSSLFSIQPTGGTGIFANMVSGGCEPVFSPNYIRTTIVPQIPEEIKDVCPNFYSGEFFETSMFKFEKEGDETILKGKDKNGTMYKIDKSRGLTKEVECKDYGYKILEELGEWDKNADWAVTSSELNVEDHLRDLKGFAKYLDASASKTISVPNNYPFYKFENVYLDAYKTGYIKGVTTYRVGTMANVLSSEEQSKQTAIKNQATKRPKSLSCDIHHVKVTKRLDKVRTFEYLVIVGSLNDKPYEIFACENGQLDKKYIKGQIIKLERGKYDLVLEDDTKIHNITKETSEMEDVVTRMVSLNLRHGIDISFIVQQLEKSGDIGSFNKAIVRALKKYIKDGVVVTGETCPNCKSENLVRSEGCVKCQDCGNSKCG
jgi:ribonucleoside-diphosphate reductase alpha chain